jgi:hypothetical protein
VGFCTGKPDLLLAQQGTDIFANNESLRVIPILQFAKPLPGKSQLHLRGLLRQLAEQRILIYRTLIGDASHVENIEGLLDESRVGKNQLR